MSFSRSDVSTKKHIARVSDLYRERFRSIKTVLFFIVSVSLLSGEAVPTHIRLCLDLNPLAGSMNSGRNLQTKSPDLMFFKL